MITPRKEYRFGPNKQIGFILFSFCLFSGGILIALGFDDHETGTKGKIVCFILGPAFVLLSITTVLKTIKLPSKKEFITIQLFAEYFSVPDYTKKPYTRTKIQFLDIEKVTTMHERYSEIKTELKLKIKGVEKERIFSRRDFKTRREFEEFVDFIEML